MSEQNIITHHAPTTVKVRLHQTCQVSRIWRELHTFLAHSRIPAAFLRINDFQTFSDFRVPAFIQNFAQYPQSLTFWFVFSFQVMFCSTIFTYIDREHRT